ncbi:tigger transposable element-derived protein 6-like, partial [Photinus pyralis]
MPNFYTRKSTRGKWTKEDLEKAIEYVETCKSIRKAAIRYSIPRKTLEYRIKKGNSEGPQHMGPPSLFGKANEIRLVKHIKAMQATGFPMGRDDVRKLAFNFAEKLGLKHKFNREKGMAGYPWLARFLRDHPELSIRAAEGVSSARARGMNQEEVSKYFALLESILKEHALFDKPSAVFNADESGLQLNNKPGKVIVEKGSKAVSTITSGEKGETVTVLACCNAEGTFIPPFCIMKGKNLKKEWADGMPPGSSVRMSEKSAY